MKVIKIVINEITIYSITVANKFISFSYKLGFGRGQLRWTCTVITFAMEQILSRSGAYQNAFDPSCGSSNLKRQHKNVNRDPEDLSFHSEGCCM